jgi:apolipoprotein D and lipocalin family protein
MKKHAVLASLVALVCGCAQIPDGLHPVAGFDANRYLGTWHEIARLDHSFERGLTHVSAEYVRADDGSVLVRNRGYDPTRQAWREVNGRARLAGAADVGQLKVTFFWPFSGSYNILVLDPGYGHALVCGNTRSYLWILARTPTLEPGVLDGLLARAREMGFDTEGLIWVDQAASVPGAVPVVLP